MGKQQKQHGIKYKFEDSISPLRAEESKEASVNEMPSISLESLELDQNILAMSVSYDVSCKD